MTKIYFTKPQSSFCSLLYKVYHSIYNKSIFRCTIYNMMSNKIPFQQCIINHTKEAGFLFKTTTKYTKTYNLNCKLQTTFVSLSILQLTIEYLSGIVKTHNTGQMHDML